MNLQWVVLFMLKREFIAVALIACLLISSVPTASAYKGYVLNRTAIDDFTLIDQHSENRSLYALQGDLLVVSFIFTRCDSVCPVITQNLNSVQQGLSADIADDVGFVSITVDPAYDTPERLLDYSQLHGIDWPLLSGTEEELQVIWDTFGVVVSKDVIDAHISMNSSEGIENQVSILYPNNTTMLLDGHNQVLPLENATGWNLTDTTMDMHNVSLNYSVHETWGISVNGINDVDAPADYSWWWSLYQWNGTNASWQESPVGIESIMLGQDTDHIAWAASNSNLSYLPIPGSNMVCNDMENNMTTNHTQQIDCENAAMVWMNYTNEHNSSESEIAECNGNGWQMGEGTGKHCMCDDGFQWAEGDKLSCVGTTPADQFEVGHSTITYILDNERKPRIAWTGDDWHVEDFISDVEELYGSENDLPASPGLPGFSFTMAVSALGLTAIAINVRSSDEDEE
ncbi:MAG TPA: SCO family protein [Candidatus Poseidoniales archaeon]|nr:SCO family protein [Candidatus Poseidoniales archaeon]